jgi:hypothetical protein
LAALAGTENHLGLQSTLEGTLRRSNTDRSWRGGFEGRLHNVDLHAAVSNQFPQQLNGRAEIEVTQSATQNGRLEQCEGSIHAGPGSVGISLLLTATQVLNMKTSVSSGPLERLVEYEELDADFSIKPSGCSIRGRCGNPEAGIVMRNQTGVLLSNISSTPAPVIALINTLVPPGRLWVPATQQTNWLMQILPVPDSIPLRQ